MKKYFITKTALFVLCLGLTVFFVSCNETDKNNDTPTVPVEYHVDSEPPEWAGYTDEPYAIIKINNVTVRKRY